MKIYKTLSFFAFSLLFIACGENKPKDPEVIEVKEQEFQDPEEAMVEWGEAWNSNDPRQIVARTAEDAVLVLNGTEVPKDSIRTFLENAGSDMADLKMNSLNKNSSDRMAYDTVHLHMVIQTTPPPTVVPIPLFGSVRGMIRAGR
ncbi:hypothetical protein LZ575_16285 [Antarcticibacterium sp. 1MA-6-2]|uniref:hypothetical protein n=1 Tax=Antarcticibacterium sp. 1MA-6-2 TaxID=2908210 RepID=UPI001F3F0DCF|nr:hypothetical protein [Antarcticibacterium sp. 1MA-6-2]UJH90381.1 hypothetical protein LZ575_16285 [Antarcticibacterium sp. 1MA-6-2]